jgi:DNA repair photolyase
MNYKQIRVHSLINKIIKNDTLFGGNYTIDPYQNCEFGCLYCDSSFDKTIYIKTNAADILRKEIKQIDKGVIIIGSVHDPYQKAEEKNKITRDLLKIIEENNFPCHILTKSDLIIRDLKLLSKIENCKITISLTSIDKEVSNIFEKNVPSPKKRLQTINKLTDAGIIVGLANIPILPYISDSEIENIIKSAKNHNAKYFLYKYLELKGDQKLCFYKILKEFYPNLLEKYQKLYQDSYQPNSKYLSEIKNDISRICNKYKLENKI